MVAFCSCDGVCRDPSASSPVFGTPSGSDVEVAGIFQIHQCGNGCTPRIGRGSISCTSSAKLCVLGGTFVHEIGGETFTGVAAHPYFAGRICKSVSAGLLMVNGGPAGPRPPPRPPPCAAPAPCCPATLTAAAARNATAVIARFAPARIDDSFDSEFKSR